MVKSEVFYIKKFFKSRFFKNFVVVVSLISVLLTVFVVPSFAFVEFDDYISPGSWILNEKLKSPPPEDTWVSFTVSDGTEVLNVYSVAYMDFVEYKYLVFRTLEHEQNPSIIYDFINNTYRSDNYRFLYFSDYLSLDTAFYLWLLENATPVDSQLPSTFTFSPVLDFSNFVSCSCNFYSYNSKVLFTGFEYYVDKDSERYLGYVNDRDQIFLAYNISRDEWVEPLYSEITFAQSTIPIYLENWLLDNSGGYFPGFYTGIDLISLIDSLDVEFDFKVQDLSFSSMRMVIDEHGVNLPRLYYDDVMVYEVDSGWVDNKYRVIQILDYTVFDLASASYFDFLFSYISDISKIYDLSYDIGFDSGYLSGYSEGTNKAYPQGFEDGFYEGSAQSFTGNFISGIIDGLDAFTLFNNFSLWNLIQTLTSLFVVLFILKLISG